MSGTFDATSKNFLNFNMWFTEGIADCIGNCEVRGKKLYMCVKSGMIARMRLQTAQAAIRAGAAPRLDRLMMLPKPVFMANAEICYALSWSFCHFLITFPKDEDRNSQIPDGRYEGKRLSEVLAQEPALEVVVLDQRQVLEQATERHRRGADAGRQASGIA